MLSQQRHLKEKISMQYYLIFKSIHVSSVLISLILFVSRSYCLLYKPDLLDCKLIKRLPHIIDSILLFSAISMLALSGQYPGPDNPWIAAKIIAMIVYIFTGLYLFRKANSHKAIYISFISAMLIYIYIVQTAVTKTVYPYPFN